MAIATDLQVQTYCDTRVRVRAEAVRALVTAFTDDKGAIDDVYAACAQQTPTWSDNRHDGPPHLAAPGDVLAYNAFITTHLAAITGDGNYAALLKLCVRPAAGT